MPGDTQPPEMGGWGSGPGFEGLGDPHAMEPLTADDMERFAKARAAEEKMAAVEVKEREKSAVPLPPAPGDLIRNVVKGMEDRIEQLTEELSIERKANRELVEELEEIRAAHTPG